MRNFFNLFKDGDYYPFEIEWLKIGELLQESVVIRPFLRKLA